jgi:hypothetical protein
MITAYLLMSYSAAINLDSSYQHTVPCPLSPHVLKHIMLHCISDFNTDGKAAHFCLLRFMYHTNVP